MAPNKVRLDLMVSERTKDFLQRFAAENAVSMSEMVDQLIIEHLMNETQADETVVERAQSTMDAIRLVDLQKEVRSAISSGEICSFTQYCETEKEGPGEHHGYMVFAPSKWDGYAQIVADSCVDEIHEDIVSTYSDLLSTVDAYLSWYQDTDGYHLMGLCIVPKGGNPTSGYDEYDWDAGVAWPDGKPEPQCRQSK